MRRKYYRIQPRVDREKFEIFQQLAAKKGMNISALARQLIDNFIKSELNEKTPA
jgi:hypothetical protein